MSLAVKVSETISGVTLEYALSVSDEVLAREFEVLPGLERSSDKMRELLEELYSAAHLEARRVLDQARPQLLPCLISAQITFLSKEVADLKPGSRASNLDPEVFGHAIERLLNLLDFTHEVRAVNVDNGSAPAGESLVRLEPSDRLRRIFSAILAGDVDALIVEHNQILNYGKTNTMDPRQTGTASEEAA